MKRTAFTMLELIFVIVIIGILAVLAMPSFNANPLKDAAEQLAEHIRYTQHLAMVEDKFDPNDDYYDMNGCSTAHPGEWYRSFWRIRIFNLMGEWQYAVFSDRNRCNNIDVTGVIEPARDPLTRKMIYDTGDEKGMKEVNLAKTYGITSVESTCDTVGWREIFFDNLGRPYVESVTNGAVPPYSNLLHNPCTITLSAGAVSAVITVQPETGYVSVTY